MPSEKRERTTTKMKAAAPVMEKPSSTSPSSSRLPACLSVPTRSAGSESQRMLSTAQPAPPPPAPTRCCGVLPGPQQHTEHPTGPAPAPARLPHASKLLAGKRRPLICSSGCPHCPSAPRRIGSLLGHPCTRPPSSPYRGAWFARCRTHLKIRLTWPWIDTALHRG